MTTDLERAFKALNGKLASYTTLFQYADGLQPLAYSTAALREAFSKLTVHFQQNWCAVVISSALDRIELKGFTVDQAEQEKALQEMWDANQLGLESDQVHEAALITHESFVIAWANDKTRGVQAYYNDPRRCHVFYNGDNPREKELAAKWWDQGGRWYLTLYYPDRLEYYVTQPVSQKPSSSTAFEPDLTHPGGREPNPFGVIPVFHFRTNRRSQNGELANILTLQDAVNKLLADMMVVAEYGAFPQRWIISNQDGGTNLKNSPRLVWDVPAGEAGSQPTQIGQFAAADLNVYLNAIDKLANSIAIISRTPKHYFYNSGTALSGEALIAMEAPLNKKVGRLEENFGVVWQELAAFLLKLADKGDVPVTSITPTWEPIQSVQPFTEAQTIKLGIDAGIPLVTLLRRAGWDAAQLAQLEKDQKDAKAQSTSEATALLAKLRQDQAQANPPGTPMAPGQPSRTSPFAPRGK